MKRDDAEEFTQSLGQIAGGTYRQIELAKKLGVPAALGLSAREWVEKRLGGYVKYAVEHRIEIHRELRAEDKSLREIAELTGVDEKTVRNDLSAENSAPVEAPAEASGDEAAENSAPDASALVGALAVLGTTETQRKAAEQKPHVANNGGENEWYTPPDFIQAARHAMGRIDCDPASSEIANRTVGAKRFFTKEQDGLTKKWSGAVWMNPPYAQPLIAQFSEAVSSKFESGEIEQACILVNNATETEWFQRMLSVCTSVCFPQSRIRFLDPQGNPGAPLQGQAVIYMGRRFLEFRLAFTFTGIVLDTSRTGFDCRMPEPSRVA